MVHTLPRERTRPWHDSPRIWAMSQRPLSACTSGDTGGLGHCVLQVAESTRPKVEGHRESRCARWTAAAAVPTTLYFTCPAACVSGLHISWGKYSELNFFGEGLARWLGSSRLWLLRDEEHSPHDESCGSSSAGFSED